MKITLREYQKEDFQELENMIRETWHYDEFSSSETAARLARVFKQLLNQSHLLPCCGMEWQTSGNYFV